MLMRYMPQPVITGFTAGIAVSIFSSQVKDALGLRMGEVPADFIGRWTAYGAHLATTQPAAVLLTVLGLAVIVGLRHRRPKWPGFLIALCVCTLAAPFLGPGAETIGSRFGELPASHLIEFDELPSPLALLLLILEMLAEPREAGRTGSPQRAQLEVNERMSGSVRISQMLLELFHALVCAQRDSFLLLQFLQQLVPLILETDELLFQLCPVPVELQQALFIGGLPIAIKDLSQPVGDAHADRLIGGCGECAAVQRARAGASVANRWPRSTQ